jgi:trimeric autotransporter adhesin
MITMHMALANARVAALVAAPAASAAHVFAPRTNCVGPIALAGSSKYGDDDGEISWMSRAGLIVVLTPLVPATGAVIGSALGRLGLAAVPATAAFGKSLVLLPPAISAALVMLPTQVNALVSSVHALGVVAASATVLNARVLVDGSSIAATQLVAALSGAAASTWQLLAALGVHLAVLSHASAAEAWQAAGAVASVFGTLSSALASAAALVGAVLSAVLLRIWSTVRPLGPMLAAQTSTLASALASGSVIAVAGARAKAGALGLAAATAGAGALVTLGKLSQLVALLMQVGAVKTTEGAASAAGAVAGAVSSAVSGATTAAQAAAQGAAGTAGTAASSAAVAAAAAVSAAAATCASLGAALRVSTAALLVSAEKLAGIGFVVSVLGAAMYLFAYVLAAPISRALDDLVQRTLDTAPRLVTILGQFLGPSAATSLVESFVESFASAVARSADLLRGLSAWASEWAAR